MVDIFVFNINSKTFIDISVLLRKERRMNFKFILLLLLTIINHALGEFLQMSLANVNTSMILKRISGITITACHMECAKQSLCHSIAVTERSSNKLPDCLLLKEDNGFYGAGNEMTTIHVRFYANF